MDKKVKIAFDGKRAVQNNTGLGNYSRYIVRAIYKAAKGNGIWLYAPKRKANQRFEKLLEECPGLHTVFAEGLWKKFKALWRCWGVTKKLKKDGIEIYHGLSGELPLNIRWAKGIKSVVTIHDLIFLRYPKYYHAIDCLLYTYKFRKACRNADKIVAISECTKKDIIHFFHTPAEKIQVIYQDCDEAFSQPIDESQLNWIRIQYALPEKFILNVGTIEERKNAGMIIQAMEKIPEDICLVIIGRKTSYSSAIQWSLHGREMHRRVIFLNSVPFEHLLAIYKLATVFAYPSHYEGFGIPVLEAIRSGLPVVAASGSCLEEAGGPDCFYVDPDDVDGMAMRLNELFGSEEKRKEMVRKSQEYAKRFQAKDQAKEIMEVYHELLNKN